MVRHLSGALKRPEVVEIGGDAHRPKRMVADLGRDVGGPRAPLDHRIGVGLGQGDCGELAARAAVRLKRERLWITRKPAPSMYSCK